MIQLLIIIIMVRSIINNVTISNNLATNILILNGIKNLNITNQNMK